MPGATTRPCASNRSTSLAPSAAERAVSPVALDPQPAVLERSPLRRNPGAPVPSMTVPLTIATVVTGFLRFGRWTSFWGIAAAEGVREGRSSTSSLDFGHAPGQATCFARSWAISSRCDGRDDARWRPAAGHHGERAELGVARPGARDGGARFGAAYITPIVRAAGRFCRQRAGRRSAGALGLFSPARRSKPDRDEFCGAAWATWRARPCQSSEGANRQPRMRDRSGRNSAGDHDLFIARRRRAHERGAPPDAAALTTGAGIPNRAGAVEEPRGEA